MHPFVYIYVHDFLLRVRSRRTHLEEPDHLRGGNRDVLGPVFRGRLDSFLLRFEFEFAKSNPENLLRWRHDDDRDATRTTSVLG